MQELQLTLTLAEVNQILEVLGERTYREVYQLVTKIQQQASAQLQEPSFPDSTAPTDLAQTQ